MENRNESRRTIIKRMAYVAPIVLTLAATPAFARHGSSGGQNSENEGHRKKKPKKRGFGSRAWTGLTTRCRIRSQASCFAPICPRRLST